MSNAPSKTTSRGSNLVTWILVVAVLALIGINIAYVVSRDGVGARVDEPAPNFTLSLFEPSEALGAEVELASLQGKAVVLEFWSTTCGACRKGFPIVEGLHREGRDDLVVLTVNTEAATPTQARKDVARFVEQFGYTVPILMDNGSVSRAYDVRAIPHTVIIDREGRIASMHTGVMRPDELRAGIAEALD